MFSFLNVGEALEFAIKNPATWVQNFLHANQLGQSLWDLTDLKEIKPEPHTGLVAALSEYQHGMQAILEVRSPVISSLEGSNPEPLLYIAVPYYDDSFDAMEVYIKDSKIVKKCVKMVMQTYFEEVNK